VLVDAAGSIGAAAVTEGNLSSFEMAKEVLPLLFGGGAVLLAGAKGATAGDERPVTVDGLLGVDRFVPHRGIDVVVADHELGDVGRHPVHHRVRDKDSPEIVGEEPQRLFVGTGQAGGAE